MSMAMRMMKKMGWQEGKGLGKNQGGHRPLVVKKDGRDTGRIIKSKALFFSSERTRSKTICLRIKRRADRMRSFRRVDGTVQYLAKREKNYTEVF